MTFWTLFDRTQAEDKGDLVDDESVLFTRIFIVVAWTVQMCADWDVMGNQS